MASIYSCPVRPIHAVFASFISSTLSDNITSTFNRTTLFRHSSTCYHQNGALVRTGTALEDPCSSAQGARMMLMMPLFAAPAPLAHAPAHAMPAPAAA